MSLIPYYPSNLHYRWIGYDDKQCDSAGFVEDFSVVTQGSNLIELYQQPGQALILNLVVDLQQTARSDSGQQPSERPPDNLTTLKGTRSPGEALRLREEYSEITTCKT